MNALDTGLVRAILAIFLVVTVVGVYAWLVTRKSPPKRVTSIPPSHGFKDDNGPVRDGTVEQPPYKYLLEDPPSDESPDGRF